MKKAFVWVLIFAMVLGLVSCSSVSSGVTMENLITAYNSKMSESKQIDTFQVSETDDGFSFEKDHISGTMDKQKNINQIKFVNENVACENFSSKNSILALIDKILEQDMDNLYIADLNAHDCISQIEILYNVCFKDRKYSFDEACDILTSKEPVKIEEWTISVSIDETNGIATIEAAYNNQ